MYKKFSVTKMSLLLALSLAIASCKKDNDPDPNSPSFKIDASEKLEIPSEVKLPDNLPNGNERVATYFAQGVQIYKAQAEAGTNPTTYQWVLVGPKADLYDHANNKIGTHYTGPTWKLNTLKDSIVAQKFSPEKIKAVDPNAVEWLQLMPKVNTTPTGIFKNVTYVQRIATTGGKPSGKPANANETVEVNYTAIYRFSKMK
ncbi:hypothetical protein WSM22_23310 [Cytophagales bacterium WSM2-2]|nr:hypothetical protein WSM22_23310 [Cytophagales bacterium WSM2-2]